MNLVLYPLTGGVTVLRAGAREKTFPIVRVKTERLPWQYEALKRLLDVALATVADIVPLLGENRILVKYGLKLMADSRWPGVRALVETVGMGGRMIKAGHVGFILAPRLNAAGRPPEAEGPTLSPFRGKR